MSVAQQSWDYQGLCPQYKRGSRKDIDHALRDQDKHNYIIYQYSLIKQKGDVHQFDYIERNEFITKHTINHMNDYKRIRPFLCEILPEGQPVKMFFDIDFRKHEHPMMLEELEENGIDIDDWFMDVLRELCECSPCKFNTCGYFTSIDPKGDKISAHLVFDFYVGSTDIAKKVYEQWIAKFTEKNSDIVDMFNLDDGGIKRIFDAMVYTKNRAFRMIYSDKTDSVTKKRADRPKQFKGIFSAMNDEIEFISDTEYREIRSDSNPYWYERHIVEMSLITHIETCEGNLYILPAEIAYADQSYINSTLHQNFDMFDQLVHQAMDLLNQHKDLGQYKFEIRDTKDNYINLINPGGYDCPSCKRCHPTENPRIKIYNNIKYKVYWECRRPVDKNDEKTKESIYLGSIDKEEDDPNDVSDEIIMMPGGNTTKRKEAIETINNMLDHLIQPGDIKYIDTNPKHKVDNKVDKLTEFISKPKKYVANSAISREKDTYIRNDKTDVYLTSLKYQPRKYIYSQYLPFFISLLVKHPIITIEAQMGSGKTHGVIDLMKIWKDKRVIILSPRIKFAEDIYGKFKREGIEVTSYLEKDITFDNYKVLIISPESLYRFEGCQVPDVIICDELMTIRSSFNNTKVNARTLQTSKDIFETLMGNKDTMVLALDADMNSEGIQYINKLTARKPYTLKKALCHKDQTIVKAPSYNNIMSTIYSYIRTGKHIAIVCATMALSFSLH